MSAHARDPRACPLPTILDLLPLCAATVVVEAFKRSGVSINSFLIETFSKTTGANKVMKNPQPLRAHRPCRPEAPRF